MQFVRCLLGILLLASPCVAQSASAEADRIRKSWELEMEKWSLETRAATTPEARAAVLARQPDSIPHVRRMWQLIQPALDQAWTLESAAWFLRVAPGLFKPGEGGGRVQVFSAEISAILKAVDTSHVRSSGITPVCMALATLGDPRALPLLEKIQSTNPDPKIQGVAALASAIVLKSFGDDPEVMRKRLNCLRKAIIESSDVDLGGGTVAQVAEDELYIIRHLAKGRIAPDLTGSDSASRPLKLDDFKGRMIMLLFWSSTMPDAEATYAITNAALGKFQGRPVEVIGVNLDPLEKLRSLEAEGVVNWKSFSDPAGQLAKEYRIRALPVVYILDGERKIHFAGTPGSFAELTLDALLTESPAAGKPGE
jgi:peroxiredoxin